MSSAAWRVLPPSPPLSSKPPPRHPLHDHSTQFKKTAASRRRRALPCRATGSRGDDGLLWLPRRDVLTGLGGIAAGLVGYPDLASAAQEANPVDSCPRGDKVTDNLIECRAKGLPCPPPPESQITIVDFDPKKDVTRMRFRKPAHLLKGDDLEKFKKAVSEMKKLPPSNPLSFDAQAAVHQAYCDGHYGYRNDPTVKDRAVDVHFSWIFAPWHRMYIYFYERALGKLIGDDSFALPYWNWDMPAGMAIPAIFKDDPLGNPAPLYDPNRNLSHLDALVDLDYLASRSEGPAEPIPFNRTPDAAYENAVRRNLCTMYQQQIRVGKDPRAFLGEKLCREASLSRSQSQGTLERMAHTSLHVWVGRPTPEGKCTDGVEDRVGNQQCNYDMGFLGTAARDPLFYSHHANVDRLWHIWYTKLGGKNFDDPEWLDNSFVFYDYDNFKKPRLVRMKFSDVLDVHKLGYTYEEDKSANPLPWIDSKPTRLPPSKGSSARMMTRSKRVTAPPKFPLVLSKDQVVVVPAVPVPVKEGKKELVLVIEGIEYDPGTNSKFDVAINVPKEDALQVRPEFSEYAGSFSVVPSSNKADDKKKADRETLLGKTTLFIDAVLDDLGAIRGGTVDVVLVPRTEGKIKLNFSPTIQNA